MEDKMKLIFSVSVRLYQRFMQLSLPVLISGGQNIFVLSAFILLMSLISTRCPLALVPRSTVHSSVGCRQLTANF